MDFSRFILPEGSGHSPELTRFLRQHKDTLRTADGRDDLCATAFGTDISPQCLSLRFPEPFSNQTWSMIGKFFRIPQTQTCVLSDRFDSPQFAGANISKDYRVPAALIKINALSGVFLPAVRASKVFNGRKNWCIALSS